MTDLDLNHGDWVTLLAEARDQSLRLGDDDPVPHGSLSTVIQDRFSLTTPEAGAVIDAGVDADRLMRRGSGASREYVAAAPDATVADTTGLDVYLGACDVPSDRVQMVLDDAVAIMHGRLQKIHREHIREKWGISREMVKRLRIGWSGDDDALVDALRDKGYTDAEIARSGVATSNALKHVYRCDPDADECSHDYFPDALDELAYAVRDDEIDPSEIDPEAVVDAALDVGCHRMYHWWDNRIVFPYFDADGDVRYLIGRETSATDDIPGSKYSKHVVRPHTDTDAVYEPLYGVHRFEDGDDLILTEGIADAIMAHQHGLTCLSPVTKQFKREHLDELVEYCERADDVYLLFDSEEGDVGLGGALASAEYLAEQGIDARVAELPRPDGVAKIDLADFLKQDGHDAEDVRACLDDAVSPTEHPAYDEDEHGTTDADDGSSASDADGKQRTGTRKSALWDLDIRDVTGLDPSDSDVNNPIKHHGESEDYFGVFSEGGSYLAKDQKGNNGDGWVYNAVQYCAAAGYGDPDPPTKPLSDGDIWQAWQWARRNKHLGADDWPPKRVLRYIAREHDLAPESAIESYPEVQFPPTVYNRVLETIHEEYGIRHGRDPVDVDYKEEKKAEVLEETEGETDDAVSAIKRALVNAGVGQ